MLFNKFHTVYLPALSVNIVYLKYLLYSTVQYQLCNVCIGALMVQAAMAPAISAYSNCLSVSPSVEGGKGGEPSPIQLWSIETWPGSSLYCNLNYNGIISTQTLPHPPVSPPHPSAPPRPRGGWGGEGLMWLLAIRVDVIYILTLWEQTVFFISE